MDDTFKSAAVWQCGCGCARVNAGVAERLCPAAERGKSLWMTPSSLLLCNSASRKQRPDFLPVGSVRAKYRYMAARAWLRTYVQQLSDAIGVDEVSKSTAV